MTQTLNFTEVEAKLSALVDEAAAGEVIVLSRAGRPVARLMPLAEPPPRRPTARDGIAAPGRWW